MIDFEKIQEIEDPETKEMVTRLQEFVYPKLTSFQEELMKGGKKPNFLKILKVAKKFFDELTKEYKEKYDRDLNEDVKKVNEKLGINMNGLDVMNLFKKM
jgi:hypothetical protein